MTNKLDLHIIARGGRPKYILFFLTVVLFSLSGKFSRGHNELKQREAKKDDERDSNTLKDKKGKANETSSSSYRDDDLPASDSSRHRDRKHNRDPPQEPRLKRENRSSNSQSSKDTERTTYRDKEKSSERPGDKERRRKDDRDRNDDKKSRYEKMKMKSENEAKKDKMRQEKKRFVGLKFGIPLFLTLFFFCAAVFIC